MLSSFQLSSLLLVRTGLFRVSVGGSLGPIRLLRHPVTSLKISDAAYFQELVLLLWYGQMRADVRLDALSSHRICSLRRFPILHCARIMCKS